ncbi:MAG: DUF4382 domain-containing protein [Chitinophagaceae bacterium]|nr:MAG: DUF4382 domain-containing protein [Chitinophagaceae bacterium]
MKKLMIVLAVLAFGLAACNKDEKNGEAKVEFRLIDAPELYDEVNVHIIGLELIRPGGPVSLAVNPGVYNLLDFTNGNDTIIATDFIPAGKLNQIRLILGEDSNTIVKNGVVHPLSTPSAQQSGLKVNVNHDLVEDMEYVFWIDFDASKSIVETGAGAFILKPVLRVFLDGVFGTLSGNVSPVLQPTAVSAITGSDTISTFIDPSGGFYIMGLDAGTYEVLITPPAPANDTIISNVDIVNGQNTDLGTVQLN